MQSYWPYSDARTCCAFCRKLLPVNDGQLLAWRSANGLFFCADHAEGALSQSRGRSDRQVQASLRPL
jgi:hypothetical protein